MVKVINGPAQWRWLCLGLVLAGLLLAACRTPGAAPTATFPPPPAYPPAGTVTETAVPSATPNPPGYPALPTRTPGTATGNQAGPGATAVAELFFPYIPGPPLPTPTPIPPDTPTPEPSPTPTIDFRAVRAELQARGRDLAFNKIGFHVGIGGNMTGIGDYMRQLDAAGVPFVLKSADTAGPIFEAQEIVRNSDVPHVLVYRRSSEGFDTPIYSLSPQEAARRHWALHKAEFPPELDPELVWLETMNEVDKGRAEWLGQFALETARLALADGFRWAAFGWSSGEPEISHWETPSMLAFLRLAAANPDRLAIALHEYSFVRSNIGDGYPYKVGRFQQLFDLCDRYGIPRPTVLITEWGWEYQNVPDPGQALRDIAWAAELYAPYPEVKGAAIWYLGAFFGDIDHQTQALIRPVTEFSLGTYFEVPLPPEQAPINPDAYMPP